MYKSREESLKSFPSIIEAYSLLPPIITPNGDVHTHGAVVLLFKTTHLRHTSSAA